MSTDVKSRERMILILVMNYVATDKNYLTSGGEVHNATLGDISFKLPYNGDTITLIYNRAAIGSKGQKET